MSDDNAFDQWAIIEMLGHRRVAGRVRETTLAGAGFLRLDIPATGGHLEQTQYIAPGSVYALHPVSEDVARAVAAHCRPQPVNRWELPAAAAEPGDVYPEAVAAEPDDDLDGDDCCVCIGDVCDPDCGCQCTPDPEDVRSAGVPL